MTLWPTSLASASGAQKPLEPNGSTARAERPSDFTFVVGGVADNCTWWSYETEAIDSGTRLTERWWVVNLTEGFAAYTAEQKQQRADRTAIMLKTTIEAIKKTAESA